MAAASIRVICGPTAAGKSWLAMQLAERHPLVILSADSRQIYRGFDVGTAKPSAEERARVPHRGMDVADPTERFSAARWAAEAAGWLEEARESGREPLVVGGTGFYIGALARPLFVEPPVDEERREAMRRRMAGLSTGELRRWCEELDPPRAHLGRVQLGRSIEVALLTGVRLSEWHRRAQRAAGPSLRYLVVDPGEDLERTIVQRVDEMLSSGWEEEVRGLMRIVPADAPAWKATGYMSVRDLVAGRLTREEAVRRIVIDTRQYAKRQRTWFRHQLPSGRVTLLDPRAPDAFSVAERWWHEGNDAGESAR